MPHAAQARDLVAELPFTYLHVFPYSPRDGTAAVELPDPVPQRIAGERARELRLLAEEKGRAPSTHQRDAVDPLVPGRPAELVRR